MVGEISSVGLSPREEFLVDVEFLPAFWFGAGQEASADGVDDLLVALSMFEAAQRVDCASQPAESFGVSNAVLRGPGPG